ncbi:MAG TPA: hypothetical protein VKT19_07945 [Steroidobacteraceae bacterium]|nr:hypothetical protein [Steroidobacteraceae bacterium]
MSTLRAGQPGATRLCPHCKATVLESASICPGCRHHLRFSGGLQLAEESYTALSVDGTIAHRQSAHPCEYCIVLDISNERGEQVMRQVVGVGALQPGELRRLNLSVQMLPLVAQAQPRAQTSMGTPSPATGAARPAPSAAAGGTPATATPRTAPAAAVPTRSAGTAAVSAPAKTAAAAVGAPTVPASASAASPPAAPAAPAAAPAVPAPAAQAAPAPGSSQQPQPLGTTQSQRLRIFRKP